MEKALFSLEVEGQNLHTTYCYDAENRLLTVKMEKPNTARLFKIGRF